MGQKRKWNFPSNNFGQIFGIADSGVETFKGTPMKSLAREICQNSLDANDQSGQPTKIEFKAFQIAPSDIPDFEGLYDALKRSLAFWSGQTTDRAKSFFETALSVANNVAITCLRISDYNTTGLTGAREEYNSAWCNLTKSSGASDKSGSNGGSFGIGKYAPFACSVFRTVFYSTLDSANQSAYQGVSRLTSFRNASEEITQGIGFYGGEKNAPVYEQISLDSEYHRLAGQHGTDIFILGFNGDEHWREQMVASILDGFLYAVFNGTLVVDVDGTQISKDTLDGLVESHKDYFRERADEYYQTLLNRTEVCTFEKLFTEDPETCGKVTLRLMIEAGFHRRVAMVRQTGMKIKDKGHINGIIPFAGVLYIEGVELNTYLRTLENPQHLEWEVERADNQRKAKKLLQQLSQFIRESLNEMRDDSSEEELDPPVGEYLSAKQEEEAANEKKEERILDTIHDVDSRVTEVKPPSSGEQDEDTAETQHPNDTGEISVSGLPGEGGSGDQGAGNGGGNGGGHHAGNGGGDIPKEHRQALSTIPASHIRNLVRDRKEGKYTIIFTPAISACDGVIEIFMSAESQAYDANILSAHCATHPNLTVEGNKIQNINFTRQQPLKIDVQIDYHDYCPMEVKGYGNKV